MSHPVTRAVLALMASAVLLVHAGASAAEDAEAGRFIAVNGTGKVVVAPDRATLSLGVEASGRTAAEARERAAQAMQAVLAALQAQGVARADVQTSWVGLSPTYSPEGRVQIVGYQLSNQLTVRLRELDAAGAVVDAVVAAGGDAVRLQGIGFELEAAAEAEERARASAMEDARTKAGSYARLAGLTLGAVRQVREAGAVPPLPRYGGEVMLARAAAAPTPVEAGQVEVRVEVSVVFDIQGSAP